MKNLLGIIALCTFFCFQNAYGQDSLNRPKLFINCSSWGCYEDYVRTELSFFDFVRDRFQADVQILIIRQENGAGGANYTLNFIGQGKLKSQTDTLKFSTKQADSDDMIRKKLVSNLKIGLVPYIKSSDFLEQITIDLPKRKTEDAVIKKDPWKFWVFTLGLNGSLTAESNSKNFSQNSFININRIKPDLKLQFNLNYNTNKSEFIFPEQDSLGNFTSTKVTVRNESHSASGILVKTINEHWSWGGYYQNWSSIRNNINFGSSLAPALEYNIFPTSKNTQKQFRWIAQTGAWGMNLKRINERDNEVEFEPFYRLDGILTLTQPWGTIEAGVGGHQFYTEKDLYRFDGYLNVNWRVFEGFNFYMWSGASYIKDQDLYLPKGSIDRNAVLLQGAILPTNFSYYAYFGVSYTFGSINNSVVNPRMNGMLFR
ncbi:MAG: hypothetical protein MUC49_09885 [Raineya sp.]|jgi:hypothetical protein|nr:hypothetical protein [Raineya sp.]